MFSKHSCRLYQVLTRSFRAVGVVHRKTCLEFTSCSKNFSCFLERTVDGRDQRNFSSKVWILADCRTAQNILSRSLSVRKALAENTSDSEDVQKLQSIVKKRAKERTKDPMILAALDDENFCRVLQFLLNLKFQSSQMLKIIPRTTVLWPCSLDKWKEAVTFLKQNLFLPAQMLPLIATYPGLMNPGDVSRKSVTDALSWLRSRGIGEGKMQQVVSKHPPLTAFTAKELTFRYNLLLEIFARPDLNDQIVTTPKCLTMPWDEVSSKLGYVFNKMVVDTKQVVKSQLFDHDLAHVVARHKFLEQLGLYTKPQKRAITSNNPRLRTVIDSSNNVFATAVAGVSVEAYLQYLEKVKKNMRSVEDVEDDSDEELDVDDGEFSDLDSDEEQ